MVKHQDVIRSQMARDSADINEKLWSRKKLKARREKNASKKVRKAYFKAKEET